MSNSPKPRHTIDYSCGDPTQYAHREEFNSQAYCESSFPDEQQWNLDSETLSTNRSRRSATLAAVVILLTAFGLAIAILATMKLTEPTDVTPSEVMTHSITTTVSADPATPGVNVSTPPTVPPAPPATMTNPVVTTTVIRPEPAPATMTNPLEPPATMTNPVVTTTVIRPEPVPATMTNPLEPPATMTNPLEPEGYEDD